MLKRDWMKYDGRETYDEDSLVYCCSFVRKPFTLLSLSGIA